VIKDDRTVSVRPVQRGISTSEVIAVTRGLEAGERVVTEGGDRLRDGARVQLAADRPASAASGARRGASAAAGASGAGSGARQRRQRSADGA
jgi:multidrug efflux system membrane fusion protein